MNSDDRILFIANSLSKARGTTILLSDIYIWAQEIGVAIHVAVMVEPYLSKICAGEKYIESRLTKVRVSPYQCAAEGDIILFKHSGGPIRGIASVDRAMYTRLSPERDVHWLVDEFGDGLGYEPGYAESKSAARFGSLLWLRDVHQVEPVTLAKRDRHAWVAISAQPPTVAPQAALFPTQL